MRTRMLLIGLVVSLTLNVYLAMQLLVENNIAERDYEVKITELYFPRDNLPDARIVRVFIINYSNEDINDLTIRIKWIRGDEVFHTEEITVSRVEARSYFLYDYGFQFDGQATRIIYEYDGVRREFHPIQ
ncbi:MAG: hypothetical protein NXY59_07245 [Aigarchaeota archaeon]|nr:hypothetical protein [Candidatus Pelearchaeum maunauluense]